MMKLNAYMLLNTISGTVILFNSQAYYHGV